MQTFESLGLRTEIVKALQDIGFESPTPIQAKTIPHLLTSQSDLKAFAQTGTGKTAAFGLPILHLVDNKSLDVQAIILCPTRELCLQISTELNRFLTYLKGIQVTAVYGGESISMQIRALSKGPQIVVGTPGRVIDLINRKKLKLENVKWLVLDEADEMLSMGFKDDLDTILAETPEDKQTLLFSATMPKEIESIARKYMHNPELISAGERNTGADNVRHLYCLVRASDKYEALKRILDIQKEIYGIVFCRTRAETQDVANQLIRDGYRADALHGDMSQAQRDHVMDRFRTGGLQLLVATDVAARGLDVNELTHVINYTMPDNAEIYIHRSGRTGRAGKSGICISLMHSKEKSKISFLERKLGKRMEQKRIPSGKEICERKLEQIVEKVEQTPVNEEEISQFLPMVYEKLGSMSWENLIKQFVSMEFNRILADYGNAPDLNTATVTKKERDKRRSGPVTFSRFFINLGEKDNLTPPRLIGIINDQLNRRDVEIGKIEILRNFSFFDIDETHEQAMVKSARNASYNGQAVSIELKKGPVRERERGGNFGTFKKSTSNGNPDNFKKKGKKKKLRQYAD